MFGFELVIFLIILGLLTGFFSGLLGIGGGTIIVPGLAILFHYFNYQTEGAYMQFSAGSALAIMIFSSFSATRKNYNLGMIHRPILKPMAPSLIIAIILGAIAASNITSNVLSLIFALLLIYILFDILIRMFFKKTYLPIKDNPPPVNKLRIGGFIIGFLSGLLGLGGGTITVPFLNHLGLTMKKAAGTSSAISLIISLVGSTFFLILGYFSDVDIKFATGYIYWPAVLLIIPFTIISAPYGVKLKEKLSEGTILLIFILYLLVIIAKMGSLFIVKII